MRAVPLEPGHRLNVLLSARATAVGADDTPADGPRWIIQLPRLLEPQGVRAIRVGDVDEAVRVIEREPIHAAVVDLALPLDQEHHDAAAASGGGASGASGGLKLLRVIHRLDPSPPTVVVRDRRFDRRADDRMLAEALKLDAFSVIDQPVQLEQVLDILRRLLQRFYGGQWPTPGSPGSPGSPGTPGTPTP